MYVYNLLCMYICVPLLHSSVRRAEEARVCSVLQCAAVSGVLQCITMCCSVVQCVAVWCDGLLYAGLQCVVLLHAARYKGLMFCSVVQCGAV